MRYNPPRRHKGAILFIRNDPAELMGLTPALQEENCRRSCEMRGIPVRTVIRTDCHSDEALEKLREGMEE